MPYRFGILTFLASITIIHTTPLAISPRDENFSSNLPTCGNEPALTDGEPIALSTTITVNTRPDCDTVINEICNTAVAQAPTGGYYGINATSGTCEGHMLFSQPYRITYQACVKACQKITETCILIDPKVDNAAKVGNQFGVMNVIPDVLPTPTRDGVGFEAGANWNDGPGYMIGATGVFGIVGDYNVSAFVNGTLHGVEAHT